VSIPVTLHKGGNQILIDTSKRRNPSKSPQGHPLCARRAAVPIAAESAQEPSIQQVTITRDGVMETRADKA
jgi:hypothetical protein